MSPVAESYMALSSITANDAPCWSEGMAYWLPSKDSPLSAKNIEPSGTLRLSVVISGCSQKIWYKSSILRL